MRETPPLVARYTIKDLEKLTGIKAHTIRIWEQRYNLLCPERTNGNVRLYDDKSLKKILNVVSLLRSGLKISHVSRLRDNELHRRLLEFEQKAHDVGAYAEWLIDKWVLAMIDLDEYCFHASFTKASTQMPFIEIIEKAVIPFLQRVGIMWRLGDASVVQEHFISHLIRQKIIAEIDKQYKTTMPTGRKVMLYLPEGEWHELGLLVSKYLFTQKGHQVVYLGQSVPMEDVLFYCKNYKPHWVMVFFSMTFSPEWVQNYINNMMEKAGDEVHWLLSGYHFRQLAKPALGNFTLLHSPSDLVLFLSD